MCCIQLRGFLASVWFAKSKYHSLPNGCQGLFPVDQFNTSIPAEFFSPPPPLECPRVFVVFVGWFEDRIFYFWGADESIDWRARLTHPWRPFDPSVYHRRHHRQERNTEGTISRHYFNCNDFWSAGSPPPMQPPGTGFCGALTDPSKQIAQTVSSALGNAGFTTFAQTLVVRVCGSKALMGTIQKKWRQNSIARKLWYCKLFACSAYPKWVTLT